MPWKAGSEVAKKWPGESRGGGYGLGVCAGDIERLTSLRRRSLSPSVGSAHGNDSSSPADPGNPSKL